MFVSDFVMKFQNFFNFRLAIFSPCDCGDIAIFNDAINVFLGSRGGVSAYLVASCKPSLQLTSSIQSSTPSPACLALTAPDTADHQRGPDRTSVPVIVTIRRLQAVVVETLSTAMRLFSNAARRARQCWGNTRRLALISLTPDYIGMNPLLP